VTFISIHSVIICVVFFGAYMRCTRLCPLKPGVTDMEHEGCRDEFVRGLGYRLSINYGCGGSLSLYDVII
jgi:hypothetical protein